LCYDIPPSPEELEYRQQIPLCLLPMAGQKEPYGIGTDTFWTLPSKEGQPVCLQRSDDWDAPVQYCQKDNHSYGKNIYLSFFETYWYIGDIFDNPTSKDPTDDMQTAYRHKATNSTPPGPHELPPNSSEWQWGRHKDSYGWWDWVTKPLRTVSFDPCPSSFNEDDHVSLVVGNITYRVPAECVDNKEDPGLWLLGLLLLAVSMLVLLGMCCCVGPEDASLILYDCHPEEHAGVALQNFCCPCWGVYQNRQRHVSTSAPSSPSRKYNDGTKV
jgi:hypothetical protein